MYRVAQGLRSRPNQDGAIVLDIQHGRLLRLNPTGFRIFECLDQGQTESQIATGISEQFHISHEAAQKDVAELLKSMEALGLVRNDNPEVRL